MRYLKTNRKTTYGKMFELIPSIFVVLSGIEVCINIITTYEFIITRHRRKYHMQKHIRLLHQTE